jgi:hypothetical protein
LFFRFGRQAVNLILFHFFTSLWVVLPLEVTYVTI